MGRGNLEHGAYLMDAVGSDGRLLRVVHVVGQVGENAEQSGAEAAVGCIVGVAVAAIEQAPQEAAAEGKPGTQEEAEGGELAAAVDGGTVGQLAF